ncbi:YheC/YheD family endospore coat-associated protein [Litchfieldia alkalitelluris]|uniref:YheC/YheD family endospore coat-associated protein n=1 Tax=Litchfieldia alkalitelluris TaxID=304268 RepID=UPI001955F7EF|nr:YheC/YheD family protein [Litchfieldia alkalitelluris]
MSEKIYIEIKAIPDELLPTPHIIEVGLSIANTFNIKSGQKISLQCGRNSQQVEAVCIKESEPTLYCSHSVLTELMLPHEDIPFTLTALEKNILSLGPVVSVITEIAEKNNSISLGSIEDFCVELARYCNQLGILFYVTGLKLFRENIGFIYINNTWKKSRVPTPNVVHNRIHSRKREHSDTFKEFTDSLSTLQIPYFNDHFLNKWEVHEILEKEDHIHPYLPDTKLLLNKQVLDEMISNYPTVFLKPIHGSQGKRIFKITRNDDGFFELDYTTFAGEIEQEYDSLQSLFLSLRSRLNKQGYIIQQGISLYTYQQRPLDFRFLCQKTKDEEWKITSTVARVSSKGDFVSNLSRGGELKKVDEVLSGSFSPKECKQIIKMMRELTIEIASLVDASITGVFGELGIDLALDQQGKPWLIEINTKPSKNQDPKSLSSKVRPSAKAIIMYCMYLAKGPF